VRRMLGLLGAFLLAGTMLLASVGWAAAESVCATGPNAFFATVSFPAGYWTVGSHEITFALPDDGFISDPYTLIVNPGATLYPGQVLITPISETELSLLASDGTHPAAINPAQATVIRDIWGDTDVRGLAWWHNHINETLSWDDHAAVTMKLTGIQSACIVGGANKTTIAYWFRHYGPPLT
jgi:hypothetical protein